MTIELPDPFIDRRAIGLAERRLKAARVLVINGPRQVGKTSVLGVLQGSLGGTYVSLDRTADLRAARTDPTGFVTGFDEPLFIDEVQRGGDPLALAVKAEVDRQPTRGRFVLAGSTSAERSGSQPRRCGDTSRCSRPSIFTTSSRPGRGT